MTEGYRLSDKAPDLSYRAIGAIVHGKLAVCWKKNCPEGIDPDNRNRVMRMLEKLHSGDPGPGKGPVTGS